MGNIFGYIFVETDKTTYIPGETIKGKIHLNVKTENYEGNTLYLNIQGDETNYCLEQLQQGSHKRNQNKKIIYQEEIVIHRFNSMSLPVKQYTFPFELTLQEGIPESLELKEQNYECKIQYKFIAEVRTYSNFSMLLKHEQPIIIKQLIKEPKEMLQVNDQLELYEFKYFNRGSTYFEAKIEKNQFDIDEICEVTVKINNSDCSKTISRVYLQLINKIILHFENGGNNESKEFERVLQQLQNPGLSAKVGETIYPFKLQISDKKLGNKQFGTVNGRTIESSYFIKVSLEIPINCFSIKTPFILLPIKVSTQASPPKTANHPEDWHPESFETQTIRIVAPYFRKGLKTAVVASQSINQPLDIKYSKTSQIQPMNQDDNLDDMLSSLPPQRIPRNNGQFNNA